MNNNLTTGILIGIGISVGAYYIYNNNKKQINEFLKSQGINIPEHAANDFSTMSLEELVSTKEQIEDLIAETEQKLNEQKDKKHP